MRAEIISIGSELVSGQSLDTNSRWLSQELADLGIIVAFHTTLGDVLDDHLAAFRTACDRAGLVVITGGLGPTQDDLTREALALYAGVELVEDAASLAAIEAMFARRNLVMPDLNRVQALFPQGAQPLLNRVGTAPGIWMHLGATVISCLPGVPSEMKIMFQEQVLSRLRHAGWCNDAIVHRKINLFGKGESAIEAEAMDLTVRGRTPEVGITAHEGTISFRITATGATEEEARSLIEPTARLIHERFGDMVVGEGSVDVAESMLEQLIRSNATLATAESCTGGLVAHWITAMSGVSPYYLGGVVSYANDVKAELLGVPESLLASHGAVSAQVAAAMAEGIRNRLRATVGLSTTGVAGPTGGTPDKPVGLVYLGLATTGGVQTRRLEIGSNQPRDIIQQRSSKAALNWVRLALLRGVSMADATSMER